MKVLNRRMAIIKVAFCDIMSFRMNIASILVSHLLDLCLFAFLWHYILMDRSVLYGYGINEMYLYISTSVFLNAFLNTPRRMPQNISKEIVDGSISNKLIYPINCYDYYFWYSFGRGLFFMLFVGAPIIVFSAFVFGTWDAFLSVKVLAFIVSSFLGFVVEIGIAMIICALVFLTEKADGLVAVSGFMAYIFSGRLIPIEMYPDWLYRIATILPYRMAIYTPIRVLLNMDTSYGLLIDQLLWVVVLILFGKIVFRLLSSRIEIAGG